jgi:hypothetical protein
MSCVDVKLAPDDQRTCYCPKGTQKCVDQRCYAPDKTQHNPVCPDEAARRATNLDAAIAAEATKAAKDVEEHVIETLLADHREANEDLRAELRKANRKRDGPSREQRMRELEYNVDREEIKTHAPTPEEVNQFYATPTGKWLKAKQTAIDAVFSALPRDADREELAQAKKDVVKIHDDALTARTNLQQGRLPPVYMHGGSRRKKRKRMKRKTRRR